MISPKSQLVSSLLTAGTCLVRGSGAAGPAKPVQQRQEHQRQQGLERKSLSSVRCPSWRAQPPAATYREARERRDRRLKSRHQWSLPAKMRPSLIMIGAFCVRMLEECYTLDPVMQDDASILPMHLEGQTAECQTLQWLWWL